MNDGLYFMTHHNWDWVLVDAVDILVSCDNYDAFSKMFTAITSEEIVERNCNFIGDHNL